jgi:peptidoglycan/LPS O-acetylase OafA/YrhL
MTATTTWIPTSTGSTTRQTPPESATRRQLWRTGAVAGVAASVATLAFAALTQAVGVSLKVGGQAIPVAGFAQLTFAASIVGTILAVVLSRRASRPRHTFLVTTIALTFVSFLPDAFADAHTATKVGLALSHVVAAVIVIPALASRLTD